MRWFACVVAGFWTSTVYRLCVPDAPMFGVADARFWLLVALVVWAALMGAEMEMETKR